MKFSDIPQFTRSGNYRVDVPWRYLEKQLDDFNGTQCGVNNLNLDPDYQRAHVWAEDKQIKYVEFILKGGKSSRDILFNCPGWMNFHNNQTIELVDGKQRLESVRRFMCGQLRVFGLLITEFEDNPHFMDHGFIFVVNDLPTRAAVLQWYLELNDGGVVHTQEELNRVRELLTYEKENPDVK